MTYKNDAKKWRKKKKKKKSIQLHHTFIIDF